MDDNSTRDQLSDNGDKGYTQEKEHLRFGHKADGWLIFLSPVNLSF